MQPDEWIRTSVWILEELEGGHQEGVANLRSVGLRIHPTVYTAQVELGKETAPLLNRNQEQRDISRFTIKNRGLWEGE
jgi:hypothetical protein